MFLSRALLGLQHSLRASRPPFPHLCCSRTLHSYRNSALPTLSLTCAVLFTGSGSFHLRESFLIPHHALALSTTLLLAYATLMRCSLKVPSWVRRLLLPSLPSRSQISSLHSPYMPAGILSGHLHLALACLSRPGHLSVSIRDLVVFD